MSVITQFTILALFVETIVGIIKGFFKTELSPQMDVLFSTIVGIVLAVGARVDILSTVGVPLTIPYLGEVITGFILSRGSNFVHDLLELVKTTRIKATRSASQK